MPTRIVNLTGHPLVLGSARNNVRYRSEGRLRLDTHYGEEDLLVLDDSGRVTVPLLILLNGEHSRELPEPQDNTLYVVSGLVAGRVKRPDVVAPARIHREGGKAMYARALLRYTR